jgi:hypothetical protein
MPGQPTPPLILEPFAKNAAPGFIQNPIPVTTADPARASFDLGFPPQTMTEIFAGGTPPYGQDVNGIFYMITAHIAAANAGQPYLYSATLATAMGGYAKGIVLGMSDGTGLWINQTSGNTTDPDAGGAGWLPLYSYGYTSVTGLTGGTRVLTPAEYRRGVVVLSGVLSGNLQVIFPTSLRSWLVVNTCTGGFTVTVKTAGGSGVTIPPGGFSGPTEVYGDGVSLYPTVAPITIPTDVNPTPNTIAMRSNAGYIFATYFNQNSGLENFGMAAVYADAGDGYHRKIGLANFAAQIALSQFAGTVANAQVPQSAVTQHAAAILANAALTGVPTAPTPPAGDNSTRVATTAFVQGSQSVAGNGYFVLPGGVMVQWGTITWGGGSTSPNGTLVFPTPWPNGIFSITGSGNTNVFGNPLNIAGQIPVVCFDNFALATCRWRMDSNAGQTFGVVPFRWIAIGH